MLGDFLREICWGDSSMFLLIIKFRSRDLVPMQYVMPWPNWATLSGNIHKFLMLLKCCPAWPPCRSTNSSRNLLLECLNILKHFSATFVAQLYVVQFGHIVGQQFALISHLRKIHLRSGVLQNNLLNSIKIRWPVKV